MRTGHQVDVERVVAGMLNDSPEMQRRYHTSASFRNGVETLARLLGPWVEGIAGQADTIDAELAQRLEAFTRGDSLLTLDQARAEGFAALGLDDRRETR